MSKKNKKNRKNKKDRTTADMDDLFIILAESEYQLMMMHAKLTIIEEHLGFDPGKIQDLALSRFDEAVGNDME